MSDDIGHECGLAVIRLRQPLNYYWDRYGDPFWGMRKLFLLMQKQHNRGQDGAGLAIVKFNTRPGERFLRRIRNDKHNAIERLFDKVLANTEHLYKGKTWKELTEDELKQENDFLGEVMVGHLRYGTYSGHAIKNCHPLIRKHNVASRNLALAGNFNMTNSQELFQRLVEFGLNPVGDSDTQVILERISYILDLEHRHLQTTMGPESFRQLTGTELASAISDDLNITRVMEKASDGWDGGYVFAGLIGNGDAFVCRDPSGIRPGFFHTNDEVVAAASERAALANVFDVHHDQIEPIQPGHVLVIKRSGQIEHQQFTEPLERRQCTFERVYFSRGNDPDIYRERKTLGHTLAPRVFRALDHDVDHAVFSFIPNTGETAFLGLVEEIRHLDKARQIELLRPRIESGDVDVRDLDAIVHRQIRVEKIAHKDQRLRTFITHDQARRDLVSHIYDITRGIVQPDDTLVVLDDSIVRGTTLRESIITILSQLNPRKIMIVSSAPPIMYPDCYGIDMSQLGRFIAFEAAVTLLRDRDEDKLLDEVEELCLQQEHLPPEKITNHVQQIYSRFTLDELSDKIAELVRPTSVPWTGEIQVMYQSVEGLQQAMPAHTGDWYFTGRYPTPGGYKVLNTAYLNWRRNEDVRSY